MQHTNSEQIHGEWQDQHRGYDGGLTYEGQYQLNNDGQKLDSDENGAFAGLPPRNMHRQFNGGIQMGNISLHGYRLLLAVVSVCALVLVFALLIAALAFGHVSSDGSIALGWGTVAVCGTIMAVNGYFNWASMAGRKQAECKPIEARKNG
jgi:hypothetical protein